MDNGDGFNSHQQAAVDILIDHHDAFFNCLSAQVDLAACAALGFIGQRAGHPAAVTLLFHSIQLATALFIHQPQVAHRHLGLDDARLHLHISGIVRVGKQDAFLIELGNQHQIAFFKRTRRGVLLFHPADDRVGSVLQTVDIGAVGGFCTLHQLGKFLAFLLAADVIQLLQQLFRLCFYQGNDAVCFFLCVLQLAVHLFVGFLLKLLQISLGFQLLCTQAVDLFLLLFQFLSGLVQLRKDIFKAGLFRRDVAFCRFDNFLRQSQPLADGKCVGFAGNSNQQTVGRLEGFHIELAACVADARCLQSIFLDLRIMGGRTHLGTVHGKTLHDGDCQSSAFDRVGART